MGIGRPPDPYGITAPPAWPDADEDVLRACAENFDIASKSVAAQWDAAQSERSYMFDGVGLWEGGAAKASSSTLEKRIADLEAIEEQLAASARLFRDSSDAVVSAKIQIIDNVSAATEVISNILKNNETSDSAKQAAIQAVVSATRTENADVVATAGSRISGQPVDTPNTPTHQEDGPRMFTQRELKEAPAAQETPAIAPLSNQSTPTTAELDNPVAATDSYTPVQNTGSNQSTSDSAELDNPAPPADPNVLVQNRGLEQGIRGTAQFDNPGPPTPPGTPSLTASPPGSAVSGGVGMPGIPSAPAAPSSPRISAPANPVSGTAPSTSTPSAPSPANSAAMAANQAQLTEFQRSITEAASKTAAQTSIPQQQPAVPLGAAPTAQTPTPLTVQDASTAPPAVQTSSASGPSSPSTSGSTAPVAPAPSPSAPAAPPAPLGPPPTPPPAAPVTPSAPAGPTVAPPVTGAAGTGTVGAPAPVPVSAARAQREAVAAAATAGALRRRSGGSDPVQLAQRIAAALNVGITDVGFFWITGLAKDGTIVVANNYGLGYIPESVNLPEQVKMATADEKIPAAVRGTWATYPILALHGWAQHHNTNLRVVIATEDQFRGFDPGAARLVLRPDDIPETGQMEGRHRLQVIAPDAATKLASVGTAGLTDLLPPPPADTKSPEDRRATLWFEVFRPLLSNVPDRAVVQLQAFVTYADHLEQLALHRAHTATEAAEQRAAIADWVYWQHLSVLMSDAVAAEAAV